MRIKEMAKEERPRERMFREGASVLSDAELLAIILQKGTREENVIGGSDRRYFFQKGHPVQSFSLGTSGQSGNCLLQSNTSFLELLLALIKFFIIASLRVGLTILVYDKPKNIFKSCVYLPTLPKILPLPLDMYTQSLLIT